MIWVFFFYSVSLVKRVNFLDHGFLVNIRFWRDGWFSGGFWRQLISGFGGVLGYC